MATARPKGRCSFCSRAFSKSGIGRHLQSCKERAKESKSPAGPTGRPARRVNSFHIVVEGHYLPGYWMHLEVPARLQLYDLDHFLRITWLECCGHMSAFTIGRTTYYYEPMEEFNDIGMNFALSRVLAHGTSFRYEYDFGDTTELALRIVSEGKMAGRDIRLMARNDPLVLSCTECGSPAAQICLECSWDDEGLFCDECAAQHGHQEMFLPVVNSPRMGQCAYDGEPVWTERSS